MNNRGSCVLEFEPFDTVGGIHLAVHIDLQE